MHALRWAHGGHVAPKTVNQGPWGCMHLLRHPLRLGAHRTYGAAGRACVGSAVAGIRSMHTRGDRGRGPGRIGGANSCRCTTHRAPTKSGSGSAGKWLSRAQATLRQHQQ